MPHLIVDTKNLLEETFDFQAAGLEFNQDANLNLLEGEPVLEYE